MVYLHNEKPLDERKKSCNPPPYTETGGYHAEWSQQKDRDRYTKNDLSHKWEIKKYSKVITNGQREWNLITGFWKWVYKTENWVY